MLRYTVYACESQPIVIEGLEKVLASSDDLIFAGAGRTLAEALPWVIRQEPDLILIDPSTNLRGALEFVQSAKERTVRCQVVLWVTDMEEADYFRALQAGVRGIVKKTLPVVSLMDCLRAVARGTIWIDHSVSDRVMGYLARRNAPRLTPRERDIVRLVCQGLKNREISESLGITPGTVKVHLMHIFEKTGVSDRFQLAQEAPKLFGPEIQSERAHPLVEAVAATAVGFD